MDASTFTAYRLHQQRAAELDREHVLRVSHRERQLAVGGAAPVRGIRSLFTRSRAGRSHLALAGPSS